MYDENFRWESPFNQITILISALKILAIKETEIERIAGSLMSLNQITLFEQKLEAKLQRECSKNKIFLYKYLLEIGHRKIPYYFKGVGVRVVEGVAPLPEYDLDGDTPYVDYENSVIGGYPDTIFPDAGGDTVRKMELYNNSYRGTRGYWIGGNIKRKETKTVQKLNYLSESLIPVGEQLDNLYTSQCYSGQTHRGWTFGGWNNSPSTRIRQIEYLDYLTEITTIADVSLFSPRSMSTASSNPYDSFIFAGITKLVQATNIDTPFSTAIEKLNYLSLTIQPLGQQLNIYRSTENNAKGDHNGCWLLGGYGSRWLPQSTVEHFSFLTESSQLKGFTLTEDYLNFSSIGTASHIYFIGGGVKDSYLEGLNRISRFSLLEESFTPVSLSLYASRSMCSSVNSSSTGYINGGYGSLNFLDEDVVYPTNIVEKISSLDLGEYLSILSIESSLQVNHGGLSDYGNSYSI